MPENHSRLKNWSVRRELILPRSSDACSGPIKRRHTHPILQALTHTGEFLRGVIVSGRAVRWAGPGEGWDGSALQPSPAPLPCQPVAIRPPSRAKMKANRSPSEPVSEPLAVGKIALKKPCSGRNMAAIQLSPYSCWASPSDASSLAAGRASQTCRLRSMAVESIMALPNPCPMDSPLSRASRAFSARA